MNIGTVQTIGEETIAASSVVSKDGASVVLLHARETTSTGAVNAIVRSTSAALSDAVVRELKASLCS